MANTGYGPWRPFLIKTIKDESSNVKSFYFEPADGIPVPPHIPGQHLRIRLPSLSDTERAYTISSQPDGIGYRISVRKLGSASSHLHEACSVGTQVFVKAPGGKFLLDISSTRNAVLLSAGIGITPMLAMLEGAQPSPPAGIVWIHVARNGLEHPFREQVQEICKKSGIPSHIWYTQPSKEDLIHEHYTRAGRLSGADLIDLFGGAEAAKSKDWYVCGPQPFWIDIKAALLGAGVPESQLKTEHFGGGRGAAAAPVVDKEVSGAITSFYVPGEEEDIPAIEEAHAVRVTLAKSGIKFLWVKGQSPPCLLEAGEAAGADLDSGCRSGMCGACSQKMVCGRVAYDETVESTPERADATSKGQVLFCCSVPVATGKKVEDAGGDLPVYEGPTFDV